jgi:nucleotide-binding universal stress UspA family protein
MKMLEKILVATDFSEAAHDALRTARAVAAKFRSKLVLLHVIPGAVDALQQFDACLAKDPLYLPAWEGSAAAHEKLGHRGRAEQCRATATEIEKRLHFKKVEQSVRSQHWLWRKS